MSEDNLSINFIDDNESPRKTRTNLIEIRKERIKNEASQTFNKWHEKLIQTLMQKMTQQKIQTKERYF